MTHDCKRNGATTRFAAMHIPGGAVMGQNTQRHRHQKFILFLNAIDAEVPAGKMILVILDNCAAHKHPGVLQWLPRHERFVFHFTPTSCSWLNAVEGFFATLAKRRLKRGVFWSVVARGPPSTAPWKNTIYDPLPSHGPPIQSKSSPPSDAGIKCWIRSSSGPAAASGDLDVRQPVLDEAPGAFRLDFLEAAGGGPSRHALAAQALARARRCSKRAFISASASGVPSC
jgi:hypothetical protein